MMTYLTSRRVAAAAAAGLFAALSFGGVAQAITENAFKYNHPKTGYYSIDQMAMSPQDTFSATNFFIDWGGGVQPGADDSCFNTGVNLPQGATIKAVTIYYSSGASDDVAVALFRHRLSDGTQNTIAGQTFVDDTATRKSGNVPVAGTFADVNNNAYSYGFGVCLGNGDKFFAARIAYKYDNAGD